MLNRGDNRMDAVVIKRAKSSLPSINEVPLQIITQSQSYTVPYTANYQIITVGGGGGGGGAWYAGSYYGGGGGGSGYINNRTVNLNEGVSIYVTIGNGGNVREDYQGVKIGTAGGTTSFGMYLFSAGGEGGASEFNEWGNGNGANNGSLGNYSYRDYTSATGGRGGWLYYENNNVTITGSNRLYHGDGGNGGDSVRFSFYPMPGEANGIGNVGNSGCCIIRYLG